MYLWGAGRHGQLAEAGRNVMVPALAPSFSQAQQVASMAASLAGGGARDLLLGLPTGTSAWPSGEVQDAGLEGPSMVRSRRAPHFKHTESVLLRRHPAFYHVWKCHRRRTKD